jgi:ribosome-binding protein aMBF1 (putative translation factor)
MSKNRYDTNEPIVPEGQDWTTVTLTNKTKMQKSATKPVVGSSIASSTVNSASAIVAATQNHIEEEPKKTKYIAKVASDAVRMARCEKKLTQKELAQKCNMDVSIIAEIERGTCVYQAAHVNKIQSVLGVKIPRS